MDTLELEVRQLPLSLASCRRQTEEFLATHDLKLEDMDYYAGVFADEEMLAGGGCKDNIIKCIAADPKARGLGLINMLVSHLRARLRDRGNLFVFTKPENQEIFESLAFYTIGKADKAILLESDRYGIERFCEKYAADVPGPHGAIVMNCNPFTLGHQYLAEQAAARCRHLYLFVVEEDNSDFAFSTRIRLVRQGTVHLDNVTVCPGGSYMISNATFPTYFLKSMEEAAASQTALDIDIFARQLAPRLGITTRFAGEEPDDPVTAMYNDTMLTLLPPAGVEVKVIPRKGLGNSPISASRVRALMRQGRHEDIVPLVPSTTMDYILQGRGMRS